ncbi:MAG: DUF4442 domain-containing protein [Pseudomonadota bacterium]
MTPYDMIKAQMKAAIPFAAHVGVELADIGEGTATARLPETAQTQNHIGSQHAGAMFTLGEAASGAAMAGGFLPVIQKLRPVAAGARIKYVKVARGALLAEATLEGVAADHLKTLEADGKVSVTVEITIRDSENDPVAEMAVDWYLSFTR